jgi:bifunctional DNA-binding transcriptional regulator/antitoxin component of YhaV-PrlF toxin-antitoxin module
MKTTTNILAKFQTTIPALARDAFDLREGDLLEWEFDPRTGKLIITPQRANAIPPKGMAVVRAARKAAEEGKTQPINELELDRQTQEV